MYSKNRYPNGEQIKHLNEMYPRGTRVQLVSMEDSQAEKPGTLGTVFCVDAMGSIVVDWDDGRSLSLIPRVDSFHIVSNPQKEKAGDAR